MLTVMYQYVHVTEIGAAYLFVLYRLGSDCRTTTGNVHYESKGKLCETRI